MQGPSYIKKCNGTIDLVIPLSRFFRFCKHVKHAFRGVQHRLIFTLNNPNSLLMKVDNDTPLGEVFITNAVLGYS